MPATPTPAPERRAAAAGRCTPRRSRGTLKDGRRRPEPCGVCSVPGNVEELHQQHAPVDAVNPHQARLGSTLHARTLLAHLLRAGQHPHPAAGHEVFAARLEGLQPPVAVAVAFVIQTATSWISSFCPHLIDHQLADRQRVICCSIDGLSIEDQRIAWIVSVVRNDETLTHRFWMVQINAQPDRGRRGLGTRAQEPGQPQGFGHVLGTPPWGKP